MRKWKDLIAQLREPWQSSTKKCQGNGQFEMKIMTLCIQRYWSEIWMSSRLQHKNLHAYLGAKYPANLQEVISFAFSHISIAQTVSPFEEKYSFWIELP